MFIAQLIRPSFLEKGPQDISCDLCGLSYSSIDYKVLFSAKKLCFFFLPDDIASDDNEFGMEVLTCHLCLMNYLVKASGNDDINLIIIDEKEDFEMTFPPHELTDSPQYFDFSFLHEDNSEEEDDEDDLDDGYDGFLPPPDLK